MAVSVCIWPSISAQISQNRLFTNSHARYEAAREVRVPLPLIPCEPVLLDITVAPFPRRSYNLGLYPCNLLSYITHAFILLYCVCLVLLGFNCPPYRHIQDHLLLLTPLFNRSRNAVLLSIMSRVHSEPTRSTSPSHHPSNKTFRELPRPARTPSYPPVATAPSYPDPYGVSPAIVYGGTGAPPLVAKPGFSTPQYYTTSATQPPVMTPGWGPPMYIDGQGPYYTPSAPATWYNPSHRHHRRHSQSPPVQAPPSWGAPLPASHMYTYTEPSQPWPPPTVYLPPMSGGPPPQRPPSAHRPSSSSTAYLPPMPGHPPPQRPPSAHRPPSSSRPLGRPKTMSSNLQDDDNFISKWAVGAYCT